MSTPLKRQHRAQVVALGGVVVDDVEDHLDAGAVQRLDHPLELAHLLAAPAGGGVLGVGREVADRAVAPVVVQAPLVQERLVGRCGGSAAAPRRSPPGPSGTRAPARRPARRRCPRRSSRTSGWVAGEALDVGLVDDRVGERGARRAVALPVEDVVDDDATWGRRRRRPRRRAPGRRPRRPRLSGGRRAARWRRRPAHHAVDRLGVGVDQQLVGVEAVALLGRVGPVHAVAVALPGPDAGQVAVPVVRRARRRRRSRVSLPSSSNRHSSTRSACSEKSEKLVPCPSQVGPEREGPARPDLRHCDQRPGHRRELDVRRSPAASPSRRSARSSARGTGRAGGPCRSCRPARTAPRRTTQPAGLARRTRSPPASPGGSRARASSSSPVQPRQLRVALAGELRALERRRVLRVGHLRAELGERARTRAGGPRAWPRRSPRRCGRRRTGTAPARRTPRP